MKLQSACRSAAVTARFYEAMPLYGLFTHACDMVPFLILTHSSGIGTTAPWFQIHENTIDLDPALSLACWWLGARASPTPRQPFTIPIYSFLIQRFPILNGWLNHRSLCGLVSFMTMGLVTSPSISWIFHTFQLPSSCLEEDPIWFVLHNSVIKLMLGWRTVYRSKMCTLINYHCLRLHNGSFIVYPIEFPICILIATRNDASFSYLTEEGLT